MDNLDIVQKLLTFINPLVECAPGEDDAKDNLYEFEEIQTNVAKIAHLLKCPDVPQQFAAIAKLKEAFEKGKIARMKITYPALVWALYKLGSAMGETEEKTTGTGSAEEVVSQFKVFEYAYKVIEGITAQCPELALKLLLQGILAMNQSGGIDEELEKIAFLYINQVLSLYQDELADSDMKYRAITLVIGTLENARLFSKENFASVAKKTTQHCAKLLKKQDQCKAILTCTHMFASESQVYFRATHYRLNKKVSTNV